MTNVTNDPALHAWPATIDWKAQRASLMLDGSLASLPLAQALSQQSDDWFRSVSNDLPSGWCLVATAGYAEGTLCPGSDLDVMLLHPKRESDSFVSDVARNIWYPFWDAGINVSPAVHTVDSALKLAATDLTTATTLLRIRPLAGAIPLAAELAKRALAQWTKRGLNWLAELHEAVNERQQKAGEAAFLLEPDLKESRGAIRDVQAIEWALCSGVVGASEWLLCDMGELHQTIAPIRDARVELHRTTKRAGNVLRLQDQDAVADRLGLADADVLMATIAEAARTVAWLSDRFWEQADKSRKKPGRTPKAVDVGSGLALTGDGVHVADGSHLLALGQRGAILRVAATAARHAVLPAPASLQWLSSLSAALNASEPWTQPERDDLLALLDAGRPLVSVVEALDHFRLFEMVLPEWSDVRSRPQRNAYHTFTVDRHLLECVVRARSLVRTVHRPDLLLLGALLHDIGKNSADDHVIEGVAITKRIGLRMALPEEDISTLCKLVDLHLLLPEVATRRDVGDLGTGEFVARALEDKETLELLRALTEADSLATGPAAWSAWKAGLVDELVATTTRAMTGQHPITERPETEDKYLELAGKVLQDGGIYLESSEHHCTVATADRRGLFATLAGVLASHGIEVLAANASTTSTHVAIDEFRITRRTGGLPDWSKVNADLSLALRGGLDIEARIERRSASYRRGATAATDLQPAQVLIDNETSSVATICEVRAPDSPALLFRLARLIASFDLDITHAKVATLGLEVVDVFYLQVTSEGGPAKLDSAIAAELKAAILSLLAPAALHL